MNIFNLTGILRRIVFGTVFFLGAQVANATAVVLSVSGQVSYGISESEISHGVEFTEWQGLIETGMPFFGLVTLYDVGGDFNPDPSIGTYADTPQNWLYLEMNNAITLVTAGENPPIFTIFDSVPTYGDRLYTSIPATEGDVLASGIDLYVANQIWMDLNDPTGGSLTSDSLAQLAASDLSNLTGFLEMELRYPYFSDFATIRLSIDHVKSVVNEPTSLALMGLGLMGLFGLRLRKNSYQANRLATY